MTTTSSHPSAGAFHEWPLVAFTTLAILGAGLMAAPLIAWLVSGTTAAALDCIRLGAPLLGAGLAVSTAHLGRPFRAPLATLGLGRSRLSAEVAAAGVAVLLAIVTAVLAPASRASGLATSAAAIAFLVTLGLVYDLPGQQSWRGAAAWTPLSSGLAVSVVGFAAISGAWGGRIAAVAAAALLADTVLFAARWNVILRPTAGPAPSHPGLHARRTPLLAARFALLDITPAFCLFAGLPTAAAALLAAGILVDRVGFYGFAIPQTTEAEIARVEDVIGSRG